MLLWVAQSFAGLDSVRSRTQLPRSQKSLDHLVKGWGVGPVLLYSTQSAQQHPELNRLVERAIGEGMNIPPLRPDSWFVAQGTP